VSFPYQFEVEKKRKTDIGQSNMNLSPLALPSSRISLVQGGVNCLPCGGWALVCKIYEIKKVIIHYIETNLSCGGGVGGEYTDSCLSSSFLLLNTRYVRQSEVYYIDSSKMMGNYS
jgi:hypothetical protein